MNAYQVEELNSGKAFSEDCYIFEDLFFLPKNFPLQNYHIKLLNEWNIKTVFSNGELSELMIKKIVVQNSDTEESNDNEIADVRDTNAQINEEKHEVTEDNSIRGFIDSYKNWIKMTMLFFNSIITKKEIDKEKVKSITDEISSKVRNNKNNALLLLGKKFEGVSYLYPQAIETVVLSVIIGQGLNLSGITLSNLIVSALFHDIGMMKVPKEILEKESQLTQQEMSTIRNHTQQGYKILLEVKYSPIIASGALQHHERLDGKGYPSGLVQNKITDVAKIIAVADVYSAAISSKPYRENPVHAKQIIQELLKGGGIAYSHVVLKELIKNISFFPIGSLVLLSNDQPARVISVSGVPMKPIVRIEKENDIEEIIDLSKREDLYIKDLYKQ